MATVAIHLQRGGSQNTDSLRQIEELARFAIDEHNKKQNTLLEFKKVNSAKEQVVAGKMYDIKLVVVDGGKDKVYETKVWVKPWMNFKNVEEFKFVGDA
ncbi:hypothetical protein OROMI_029674 [Orobanche minor]